MGGSPDVFVSLSIDGELEATPAVETDVFGPKQILTWAIPRVLPVVVLPVASTQAWTEMS